MLDVHLLILCNYLKLLTRIVLQGLSGGEWEIGPGRVSRLWAGVRVNDLMVMCQNLAPFGRAIELLSY